MVYRVRSAWSCSLLLIGRAFAPFMQRADAPSCAPPTADSCREPRQLFDAQHQMGLHRGLRAEIVEPRDQQRVRGVAENIRSTRFVSLASVVTDSHRRAHSRRRAA